MDEDNRGGLFELSDNTFQLFQAIELALCHRLVTRLRDEDSVQYRSCYQQVHTIGRRNHMT